MNPDQPMQTFFPGLEDLPWPQAGRGSEPSFSARTNPSVSNSSASGSAPCFWPTPNAMDAMAPRSQEALAQALQRGGCSNLKDLTAHPSLYPTSETLTGTTSAGSTSLLAGFPVSLFPSPGSSEARRTTVISGRRCTGLLRRQDPVSCLLRTLLESSQWNSTRCFLTWRESATPAGRLLFQLAVLMPRTDETGSGLWATPNTSNSTGAGQHGNGGDNLQTQVKMWPTPQANDSSNTANATANRRTEGHHTGTTLVDAVKMWPTPTQRDHKDTGDCENVEDNCLLDRVVGPTKASGSLNPAWVSALMGYHPNWTEL